MERGYLYISTCTSTKHFIWVVVILRFTFVKLSLLLYSASTVRHQHLSRHFYLLLSTYYADTFYFDCQIFIIPGRRKYLSRLKCAAALTEHLNRVHSNTKRRAWYVLAKISQAPSNAEEKESAVNTKNDSSKPVTNDENCQYREEILDTLAD